MRQGLGAEGEGFVVEAQGGPVRASAHCSWYSLACPEYLLLKYFMYPIEEEPVAKPSPGNCRDMLPEEANDWG